MYIHSLERNGDLLPTSTPMNLTIIILTHLSKKIQLKRNHSSSLPRIVYVYWPIIVRIIGYQFPKISPQNLTSSHALGIISIQIEESDVKRDSS